MKNLIIGVFAVGIIGVSGFSYLYESSVNYKLKSSFELEVQNGEGFNKTLAKVHKNDPGVSLDFAKLYLKINGLSRALKSGEYSFTQGQSLKSVIDDFASGNVVQYKVVIPEGYNSFEIADLLIDKKIIKSKKEFLNAVSSKKMIKELLGFDAKSLEGFLYPATYEFSKNMKNEFVIKTLVDAHLASYEKLMSEVSLPAGFDHYKLVTLASVVEKETGASAERPLIASVFHNRLKKRMRLQSDPTTIYGQWVKTGQRLFNIRKKHLREKNAYNTYAIKALPVGPISNPGYEAMRAVCKPASSEYLYFVSKNDGTHYFSKTYKEHTNAVRRFQLSKKARDGKSWRDLNKSK